MQAPPNNAVAASPPLPDPCPQGPSGDALGRGPPFARSLTRQTACKASSHPGCGKIGRSWRCAPWHRSPSYDQRRAPYDHPDFNSNALSEDLFSGSLDNDAEDCTSRLFTSSDRKPSNLLLRSLLADLYQLRCQP